MKIDIYIPDNLSEITLEQYQRFEKLNNEENQKTNFLLQKMVQIFCKIELRDVANIKFSDVQNIVQHLNDVFTEKCELEKTFRLHGVDYGFIPNLDEMTFGEYIDLDNYLGSWENMDKALSVLYRPITVRKNNKYDIEPYNGEVNASMKNAPLNIVMGCMVFFYSLSNELLNCTQNYLKQNLIPQEIYQQVQDLVKSGDGINLSMESLRVTLDYLTKSPPQNYISA